MIRGNIPKSVLYVCKKDVKDVRARRGDSVYDDIFESFPVDPDRENTVQTARRWAQNIYQRTNDNLMPEIEFLRENSPIYNIKVVGYSHRQNDTTFKAIIDDQFYVDLRIPHLMDVISNGSIVNGVITCGMIWIKNASTMTLVRENGDEHKELLEQAKVIDEKPKKIPMKDLVPGKIYSNKNDTYLFIGASNKVKLLQMYSGRWESHGYSYPRTYVHKDYGAEEVSGSYLIERYWNYSGYKCGIFSRDSEDFDSHIPTVTKSVTLYMESLDNKDHDVKNPMKDKIAEFLKYKVSGDFRSMVIRETTKYDYSITTANATASYEERQEAFIKHNVGVFSTIINYTRLYPEMEQIIIDNAGDGFMDALDFFKTTILPAYLKMGKPK